MAAEEIDGVLPWEFRVANFLPISAFWLGVTIALVLFAIFLTFSWVFGFALTAPGEGLTRNARNSTQLALLIGYAFAALRVGALGIERDLSRAGFEDAAGAGLLPRDIVRRSRYTGAISVALGFVLITAIARSQGFAMTEPWTALHEGSFLLWLFVFLFWIIGRAALFTIQGSRFAAEVTVDEIEIDLLELEPLNAFGRIGLRFALLWILGVTIAAPLLLGPELRLRALLGASVFVGVIATVALLIPVLGIRRRVRSTKQGELTQLAAAIAGDEAALSKTRIANRRGEPSLADLIAYRGLVDSAREWPYDAPTISRFALYLLIPLASWVAAAFVERAVDALLR
jgi:hypothetical protein